MDVNSVLNIYNMASLWKTSNSGGTSALSAVPLVTNVASSIKQNYLDSSYFGKDTGAQLQDIYEHVEPSYGIFAYDNSGNITIPTDAANSSGSTGILSLIQNGESAAQLSDSAILSQYNSIESGTYNESIVSILSQNPYNTYSTIDSLLNTESGSIGSNLDFTT